MGAAGCNRCCFIVGGERKNVNRKGLTRRENYEQTKALHSSFLCIYLYISRINQQIHTVFVLYLFSLFP
jgi:hypothetical protein